MQHKVKPGPFHTDISNTWDMERFERVLEMKYALRRLGEPDEIVGAVDVLTEGGPYRTSSNLLYFLYERGFRHFQFGEAAAVAVLIAVIVAGVTWAQFRFGERHVHYD